MKKFTRLSILLSLAVVLNIVESFIPLFNGFIPGFKLGLANIVILFILYKYNLKDAFYVGILRVFLVGILRTGLFNTTFVFSLSGCILSILMMFIFKKYFKLSIIGVSVVGSIFHSLGQVMTAMILLNNNMLYYLPWILLLSIPTGIIVGLISKKLLENYNCILVNDVKQDL